jgi:hypothetical protein
MRNILLILALLLATTPVFANPNVETNIGDCSITSLTGSTSQQILAANPQRKYLQIFNPAASDAIYVNLAGGTAGTTATSTGTLKIAAQGNVTFAGGTGAVIPMNAITVNGTASDAVICFEGR